MFAFFYYICSMKKIFSFLLIFIVALQSNAQYTSPYKLSLAKDITIPTIGAAMIGTAFLLERKRKPLSISQVNQLDRKQVFLFDRGATYNWDKSSATASDVLLYGTASFPLLFLIDKRSRKDFGKIAAIYSEIFLINVGITNLTKVLVSRKRPYTYNPNVSTEQKMKKDALSSFFSGHTSLAAAMSFGFAQMYSDYFPNSPAKGGVWFAAAVYPLTMALLRQRAGKHFWTDVMIGYAVGAAVGILIPRLHRVRN